MHHPIHNCRLCGGARLQQVIDLGEQSLTGVFPRQIETPLTRGPLVLVRCENCGLVQLRHSYEPNELYGPHYGYRSSLNQSMVTHLCQKAEWLQRSWPLKPADCVVDIGSNDGTFLNCFLRAGALLVGFDPSAEKFRPLYRPEQRLHVEFFSARAFHQHHPGQRARLVTSIAMFYDLEDPLSFVREVAAVLAPDGVWHLEQSYLPAMLRQNAYDTICHEHLEYYGLAQIQWMAEQAGLKVVDVSTNSSNGGSFAVTLAHTTATYPPATEAVKELLAKEQAGEVDGAAFRAFNARVQQLRGQLRELLLKLHRQGCRVFGYGASTKGNVILQYCGITSELLPCMAEVNPEKFGCFTPSTHIPIVSEVEARARQPDYFLVFPWHFREGIVRREADFLARGGKLIFPLPELEIVSA